MHDFLNAAESDPSLMPDFARLSGADLPVVVRDQACIGLARYGIAIPHNML